MALPSRIARKVPRGSPRGTFTLSKYRVQRHLLCPRSPRSSVKPRRLSEGDSWLLTKPEQIVNVSAKGTQGGCLQ